MTLITISADDKLVEALRLIAQKRSTSLDAVAREALTNYVRSHPIPKRRYSFVGIGRSGKRDLSQQVEATLAQAANRREGWSLK
jgi:plasmid stability protein